MLPQLFGLGLLGSAIKKKAGNDTHTPEPSSPFLWQDLFPPCFPYATLYSTPPLFTSSLQFRYQRLSQSMEPSFSQKRGRQSFCQPVREQFLSSLPIKIYIFTLTLWYFCPKKKFLFQETGWKFGQEILLGNVGFIITGIFYLDIWLGI